MNQGEPRKSSTSAVLVIVGVGAVVAALSGARVRDLRLSVSRPALTMAEERREEQQRRSKTTGVVIIVIVGVASLLLCLCSGFSLFLAGA